MKVLHFFKTYLPDTIGGIEKSIYEICEGCRKYGITSEVFSLSPSVVERSVQVGHHTSHRCKSLFNFASTPVSLTAFYRFRALAKGVDVIHYHFPYPFADIMHFTCCVKKPTLLTYHSDIIKQKKLKKIYSPLQRCFLGSVDRIVSTSPNYMKTSDVLQSFKDKTSVIPLGIDSSSYPTPSSKDIQKWRQKFGERFFLFVGACRYYKGLFTLVDAAANTPFPVVIAGSGYLESELRQYSQERGASNVFFLGFVSEEDKAALYKACYSVVFPSHLRSEAFGITLVEGALFGKPLISCEIGTGTTFINIDQSTGLVVPPSDIYALRQAMQYLWDNPENANQMGKKGNERYWNFFTAEQMVKEYSKIYKEIAF